MSTCKILVVSDVHGDLLDLRVLLRDESADALFFLGDGLYDLDRALKLRGALPYPVYRVCGNCDPGFSDPMEGLAPMGGVLFFYTHGHRYWVKSGTEELLEAAEARGADVALFGHTHRRTLERGVRVTAFNPGSLRDEHCYGVITVTNGQCEFGWKRVPQ